MPMTPRSTALDGDLSLKARLIAGHFEADEASIYDFASRVLTVAPDEALQHSEQVTVKLLVDSKATDVARRWIEERNGGLLSSNGEELVNGPGLAVLLATLPASRLAEADDQPWIRRVEGPRLLLPLLDQARGPATGLDLALSNFPLSGKGVVVGIIDSGVDWRHPDFHRPDGTVRIERFIYGRRPRGAEVSQFASYSAKDLDDALQGLREVPQGDPDGHGTHCASIAVGNGAASGGRYRGVAPEAALVALRSEPMLDIHAIEGIRQAFEVAGPRPAVVSLSFGTHLGAHDGTSALENEIARMTGPGRIVVVAAGNEGASLIHYQGELVEGQELTIPLRIADPNRQYVDLWIPRGDSVDLWIETPEQARFAPDGALRDSGHGIFTADFREDRLNRDQNLSLRIIRGHVDERWSIHIQPTQVLHGQVHAWASTNEPSTSLILFPDADEPSCTISMPATEERAISVGSYVSRNSFTTITGDQVFEHPIGALSPFSSLGPTRSGLQKPDIAAPGQYIVAALAGDSQMHAAPEFASRRSAEGPYIALEGTSMAAPFMAGLVALLLEREPTLNPEEIQQRLRVTARRDRDTGRVWNRGFGFGKLDARALLEYQAHTIV
jgi:subtilisin family serine protease